MAVLYNHCICTHLPIHLYLTTMHLYLVLLLAQTAGINVTNSVWSELHRCVLLLDSFDHDTDTNIGGSLIPVIPEWTSKQSNNLHKWLTSTGTSTRSHLPKLSGKVSCGFSAQHMTNWTSGILVLPVQHGKKEKKKQQHTFIILCIARETASTKKEPYRQRWALQQVHSRKKPA